MSRDVQGSSEAVVWANEATPFTGAQVKALLEENERLTKLVCNHQKTERERPQCEPPCEMPSCPWCILMRWQKEIDMTRKARHEAHALLVQAMRILELGQTDEGPEKRSGGRVRRGANAKRQPNADDAEGGKLSGSDEAVTGSDPPGVSTPKRKARPLPVMPKPRRRRKADMRGASPQEPGTTEETTS